MMIPTLLGITIVVFIIINLAPGSPIEQKLQQLRFGMGEGSVQTEAVITQEVLDELKEHYGFDKPLIERYFIWLKNLTTLDFGESFTYEEPVTDVIVSKFPVSLQFGILSLLLSYLVSIPLGIYKARKKNSAFDIISSTFLMILYSIPPFMFGILLIVFFAGGRFFEWFPMGGLYSDDYILFGFLERILDRVHHFILPLICYMLGSFTTLTLLMRNSLLEEIEKDYIRTARAKGLAEKVVIYRHALRNALIPIVTGIGGFLMIFFAGSMLLETIFQLDGIGLLGYKSLLSRDYNVIMGLVFIQSFLFLLGNLISDMAYMVVDPRIKLSS